MDAFRRRSTPFLHSSLVIEILELPRSFHGGIVDESSVPNLYRGNRSNSFFTKYGGYGGGGKIFIHIFLTKNSISTFSVKRKTYQWRTIVVAIGNYSLPKILSIETRWNTRLELIVLYIISSSLSLFFISFIWKRKRKKKTSLRMRANSRARLKPSRLLVSRGAITR